MEAASEEEIGKNMNQHPPGETKRPKRQMKTPFQLEVLERTYATEAYPSEETRAELSSKLALTDRQLQMWFCHRRLKDKKEAVSVEKKETVGVAPKKQRPLARKGLTDALVEEHVPVDTGSGHGSGSWSSSGSGSFTCSSEFENGDDVLVVPPECPGSPRTIMEYRVIACVEAQLGDPIRQDGPILGVEFDELPPGAFGVPIVTSEPHDGYRHPYDSKLFGQYNSKSFKDAEIGHHNAAGPKINAAALGLLTPSHSYDLALDVPCLPNLAHMRENEHFPEDHATEGLGSCVDAYPQKGRPLQFCSSSMTEDFISNNDDNFHLPRKRKNGDAQTGKEVQANEKKMRKEIEKRELLRRKREEHVKKEMERLDRERRKEEQRMIREQQKQEERTQREERRKVERREKFMQKELQKEERRKQKEEHRKEKEEARQKAAIERATAQRIAKESMDLIEDDRLELMDLAAARKGLPSIFAMDYDTLENLDSYREDLCQFPPKSVQLRKPFAIKPWLDSDKNIGNLLMVWKFCVTFADVLGLWPFTLDEFLQAFHDHESRLLGEIHIAILRLIVKDIEDVVRTPSGGPGTNQYSAINSEGGHPRIIEGGYFWGFEIRNWRKYLNPLTWPEVLRQFGISAGFGPQLKKKAMDCISLNDTDENKGCEETISNLRNGSAAESAVAIMQEKRSTLQRKSRHRLTPGTVKFAAYHVLALEGSKGLNVVELADKIQKSGLRDLTTSKTPEASISVALSRDPVLFERVAPSTYCVRPAFRKDPADAESIIADAKEKIHKFANVLLAGQNADEEERDDDSDSEGAEVDPFSIQPNAGKPSECKDLGSVFSNHEDKTPVVAVQQNGNDIVFPVPDQGFVIDESRSGEAWVLGLTEGEYSDLSVEERLNALVALIRVANEGNSVRVILEERMDASNALKKQMWTDSQLDKKRMKEEVLVTKLNDSCNAAAEGSLSPLAGEHGAYDPSSLTSRKEDFSVAAENVNVYASLDNLAQDAFTGQTNFPAQQNGNMTEKSRLQLKSYIGHVAEEQYCYRSLPLGQDRRRNRYWQFVSSVSCMDPGSGRIFVEYTDGRWRLLDSEEDFDALLASLDTRGTRESHLQAMLKRIENCFKDYTRNNWSSLDVDCNHQSKVKKEASKVHSGLVSDSSEDLHGSVCGSSSDKLEPSCSFRIDTCRDEEEITTLLKRHEDLHNWMSKECINPCVWHAMAHEEKRCVPLLGICNLCLETYEDGLSTCACNRDHGRVPENGLFSEQFGGEGISADEVKGSLLNSSPLRVRLIKAILTLIEATVPSEALHSSWSEDRRTAWASDMQKSSTVEDVLQIITQFEGAIRQDHISTDFETTEELLSRYDSSRASGGKFAHPAPVCSLPWIPKSTAAVAMRLLELDESIHYKHVPKADSPVDKEVNPEVQASAAKEANWGHARGTSKYRQPARGRGGWPRGKLQKRAVSSMSPASRRIIKASETSSRGVSQQSVRLPGQTHGRGRRTVRRRRSDHIAIADSFTAKKEVDEPGTSARNALAENDGNFCEAGDLDEGADGFETWGGAGAYDFTYNRSREGVETSEGDAQLENGYNEVGENAEGDEMQMNDEEYVVEETDDRDEAEASDSVGSVDYSSD